MLRLRCLGFILVLGAIIGASTSTADSLAEDQPVRLVREPEGEAPKRGMNVGEWTSGIKDFFGTAYEAYDADIAYTSASPTAPLSKVWYTGAKGILSEVYWPTIDTKQIKDSELLISDGRSFFVEEKGSLSTVEWIETGVPAFKVTNRDAQGRFSIEKTHFADPVRDTLVIRYRVIKNVPGLKFYVLHNPAVSNTSLGDSGRVVLGSRAPGEGLYAWEGTEAQALIASVPFRQVSAGFEAANDGYQDLVRDMHMDSAFERAIDGNVVLTGWLDLNEEVGISEFDVAIGFGSDIALARANAAASLAAAGQALTQFTAEWKAYQASVKKLDGEATDGGKLYRASVAVLKSMEDKTYEGAYVASPSVPWGQYRSDAGKVPEGPFPRAGEVGGYHLVWPRDLFQMASTFLAIDDPKPAIASLKYYRRIQYGPEDGDWKDYGFRARPRDGSFLQNCWVNGEPYWTELQMDQTAFPVLLAYRLWKANHVKLEDYWDMVRRASDFINAMGPWSRQERWEENQGVSPSNVSVQIAALWSAAEMAQAMNDAPRAKTFTATADAWNSKPDDNLEAWVFTETGRHGNGKYYERIEAARAVDQVWNPNDEVFFFIGNGGGWHREKDVIDGGFLELVRYGVRSALDYHVTETLHEYDAVVRVNTNKGAGFFRYNGDRYNYDDATGAQTGGMLWPHLTGERGHYEIARASESGLRDEQISATAVPYIQAMERFATASLMLPEQVWDRGDRQGEPTGSATPLGWTHGEYIKLLNSRHGRSVSDRMPNVAERARRLKGLDWATIEALSTGQ